MCIVITVAHTIPEDAFARIQMLAKGLPAADPNFQGMVIRVSRHDTTGVSDTEDELRAAHLLHLVEDAIDFASSHFAGLEP